MRPYLLDIDDELTPLLFNDDQAAKQYAKRIANGRPFAVYLDLTPGSTEGTVQLVHSKGFDGPSGEPMADEQRSIDECRELGRTTRRRNASTPPYGTWTPEERKAFMSGWTEEDQQLRLIAMTDDHIPERGLIYPTKPQSWNDGYCAFLDGLGQAPADYNAQWLAGWDRASLDAQQIAVLKIGDL